MNILGSLSKLKAIGTAIAALFPVVISAIQGAETALGPGVGSAKLSLVLATLQATYGTVQTVEATWEEVAPAITAVINAIVAALNAVKSPTPASG